MVQPDNPEQLATGKKMVDIIFQKVVDWQGKITGEHGIGVSKLPWWELGTTPEERELHRRIKNALDPEHILNPGKFC